MALLDALNSMDPDQKSAIFQGLLAGGFGAMAGRGTALQAWGQGGLAGLSGYSGALDNQLQNRMRQQQMQRGALQDKLLQGQISEQQAGLDQKLAQQNWLKNLQSPQQQASSNALSGGGGPTVENAQKMAPVDPYQQMLFEATKSGALPIQSYMASMQKDTTPVSVKDGEVLLDRKTLKPVFENMKNDKATQPEIQKLLALRTMYPEGSPNRVAVEAAITKATTHTPGVTVANYGSPVPVQLPDGTTALVQPSNKAGAPPQLMKLPGSDKPLAPAKDPNEKPLTETQGNATSFAARMKDATAVLGPLEASGVSTSQLGTMAANNNATNFMATPKGQQYMQAARNWVTANLRKESGAAIPDSEMAAEIKKYFPQPGDKPDTKAQKAQARRVAEEGMLVQAGPGAKQVAGILDRSGMPGGKQVKRTGTYQGRKVIEYADGTTEFQN